MMYDGLLLLGGRNTALVAATAIIPRLQITIRNQSTYDMTHTERCSGTLPDITKILEPW